MLLARRLAWLAPLCLAACGNDAPPRVFAPLRYDYLPPLQFNIASIDYAELPPPGPLDAVSPAPLGPAVQQMAKDRLSAAGATGRALITIKEARIARSSGGLDGALAIRMDVLAADGSKLGYAEARVARRANNIGRDLRGAVYDVTKQMLDDMNVELEFQVRRSLRDELQTTTTAPAPAPVQQQDLSAPVS